jgi:hypothetical protein
MKLPLIKLSIFAVLLHVTACTKTARSLNSFKPGDITGKWNLVSDSTFMGIGAGNHAFDYTGSVRDYFNFNSTGYVYTREGASLETLTYRMVLDTSIIISDFGIILNGIQETSTISGLTASNGSTQTIVIESPFISTPGGNFWRKVILRR